MNTEKTYYLPEELMQFLPVGRSVIYRELRAGTIPCKRIGKRVFIPKTNFHAWLENCASASHQSA